MVWQDLLVPGVFGERPLTPLNSSSRWCFGQSYRQLRCGGLPSWQSMALISPQTSLPLEACSWVSSHSSKVCANASTLKEPDHPLRTCSNLELISGDAVSVPNKDGFGCWGLNKCIHLLSVGGCALEHHHPLFYRFIFFFIHQHIAHILT